MEMKDNDRQTIFTSDNKLSMHCFVGNPPLLYAQMCVASRYVTLPSVIRMRPPYTTNHSPAILRKEKHLITHSLSPKLISTCNHKQGKLNTLHAATLLCSESTDQRGNTGKHSFRDKNETKNLGDMVGKGGTRVKVTVCKTLLVGNGRARGNMCIRKPGEEYTENGKEIR